MGGRDVVGGTLDSVRGSILGWSLGLGLYAVLIAAVYPSVRDAEGIEEYLDSMPEAFLEFFGGGDLTTVAGFFEMELFSYLPLVLAIFTIGKVTSLTLGEEEEGVLDLVLAQPLPRWRVLVGRFVGLVLGVGIVVTVLGVALAGAGVLLGFSLGEVAGLVVWSFLAGLMAVFFGASALVAAGFSSRRRSGVLVGTVVVVASFFLNGLAPLAGWLEPWRVVSPLHWYASNNPLEGEASVLGLLGLVVGTVALVGVAVWGFQRKDIDV